jgi:transcriptional regulator with XRE-family HTH domain
MEKIDLAQQFAERLRDSMIAAGYNSQRSPSGVNIDKLAEITGYSPQICRKYLRGHAIPDPIKLSEIATHLNISPGWLLFGDSHQNSHLNSKFITINKNLLHYIFMQVNELYQIEHVSDEISDFLLDLTNNISHINANEEQSKKIIDLALASAQHFRA